MKMFAAAGLTALVLSPLAVSAPFGEQPTITDIVVASGPGFDDDFFDFDLLREAVVAADLAGALGDTEANLTVFAPNDLAFILLARDLGYTGIDESGAFEFIVAALTDLGGGDPIPVLTDVLLYHVAPGRLRASTVVFGSSSIDTLLDGASFKPSFFELEDNDPDLANPTLTLPFNVVASNGVIHAISRVLIPLDL